MAKPILIITVNNSDVPHDEQYKMLAGISKKIKDYHIFVVCSDDAKGIEFKVLAEKDYKEIDLENITNSVKEVFKK